MHSHRFCASSLLMLLPLAAGIAGCEPPPPPAPAEPEARQAAQPRATLGKTTQNVLDLAAATAEGGVVVEAGAPRSGLDAITGAHRAAAGQISILAVEHKMKLDAAEHGSKPKTHAEFMKRIIAAGQPDEIRLPMLPFYQEYAFDPAGQCLVVVEFPARKEQRERETTGAAGL